MNFSFIYGGKKYGRNDLNILKKESDKTIYSLEGLQIIRTCQNSGKASSFRTEFINTADSPSKIISDVLDIDEDYPFTAPSLEYGYSGYGNDEYLYLVKTLGSDYSSHEFSPSYEALRDGSVRNFACKGGRSSQVYAPFFELRLKQKGIIFAIGWTGQWNAKVTKHKDSVSVSAGIEGLNFYLDPHEHIRTSEITVLPYGGGYIAAYNDFKKIIREASPVKDYLPFFNSFWGGATSDFMMSQLKKMKESGAGAECFWVDAGWYGDYKSHCYSEFSPQWGEQTGNWFVNRNIHPGDLQDVFGFSKSCGFKNLLWLEPERAIKGTDIAVKHPEWFFTDKREENTLLLNLGDDDARQYVTELISSYISKFKLDYYRQDFNMNPLPYWRQADAPNRQGISEIKHITGLYKMWDELLAAHPGLIIDNCASGGRRIDFETLKRSVPLWRSDYQCVFDADSETAQNHCMSFSRIIPFSSTGTGFNVTDKYHFRSCYSAGLNSNFFGYELKAPEEIPPEFKDYLAEFKDLRQYFSKDYYPIYGYGGGHDSWGGWQFDWPQKEKGIVMAFRRDNSPCDSSVVFLGGINSGKNYAFTGECGDFTVSGLNLINNGLKITIDKKRESRLIYYRLVN